MRHRVSLKRPDGSVEEHECAGRSDRVFLTRRLLKQLERVAGYYAMVMVGLRGDDDLTYLLAGHEIRSWEEP